MKFLFRAHNILSIFFIKKKKKKGKTPFLFKAKKKNILINQINVKNNVKNILFK